MKALIVYHTVSGHTRRAAQDVADGLRSGGATVDLQAVSKMTGWDVTDFSVVVVGSPCHAGSMAIRSGLPGAVRAALKRLQGSVLAGKTAGAFSVNCAYGGQRTVRAIEKHLAAAGATVPQPGVVVRAGLPLSVATGPLASEEDRQRLRQFGAVLALAAKARSDGDAPSSTQ